MLGDLALDAGDTEGAEQDFARSLAVCEGAGDMRGTANARWGLARVDLLCGRLDSAAVRLRAALTAFDEFEMRESWLGCLEDHAVLALRLERPSLAVALAAAAHAARESARLERSPRAQRRYEALRAALRAETTDADFDLAWRQGQGWDGGEALRRALESSPASPQPA